MEFFAKKIEQILFKTLDFFQRANFLFCRQKYIFAATTNAWCSKIFHQNFWKTPVKDLISFYCCKFQARGICSFTKNEVIHWCSAMILVAPSTSSFTDSQFQISFVKHHFLSGVGGGGFKLWIIYIIFLKPANKPIICNLGYRYIELQ